MGKCLAQEGGIGAGELASTERNMVGYGGHQTCRPKPPAVPTRTDAPELTRVPQEAHALPKLPLTSVNLNPQEAGDEETVKYLRTFISYGTKNFPSLGLGYGKVSPCSTFTRGHTEERG